MGLSADPNSGSDLQPELLPGRRETGALSTSANLAPSWKQEVNRRVAAHMNRKAPLGVEEREAETDHRLSPASRAAQAAARVAARYAQAPSFSEMLANEARAAALAAEVASRAASRAAQEAHAAAQSVLDSLEAAAGEPASDSARLYHDSLLRALPDHQALPDHHALPGEVIREQGSARIADRRNDGEEYEAWPSFPADQAALPRPAVAEGESSFAIRWEPDLPVHRSEPMTGRARHAADLFDSGMPDWQEAGSAAADALEFGGREFDMIEPAQPIHANLIEFPRELIATRKVRPRLAEAPFAAEEPGSQLSIFEVDPGAISIEPEPAHVVQHTDSAAWAGPEWSGMRLDAQPEPQAMHPTEAEVRNTPLLHRASASRRMLAAVVDFGLIAGAVLGLAVAVATKAAMLPGLHAVELGAGVLLLAGGALYLVGFLAFGEATPGMRYAHIRLCTLEGHAPTRRQRNARLVAMLLSVLPVGLGIGWAIFDEDHLTWHDRLSQTYLRRW
jgi:uncharacterized RDD family membrane protein YckC